MRDLGKRLERLEAISGAHVPRHELAVHFVDPERLGAEATVAEIRGERLLRYPGEPLKQFRERARERFPVEAYGISVIYFD